MPAKLGEHIPAAEGLGVSPAGPNPLAQFGVQGFPRAVLRPEPEIMEYNPIRRQVVRQRTPRAAVACDVTHAISEIAKRQLFGRALRLLPAENNWRIGLDWPPPPPPKTVVLHAAGLSLPEAHQLLGEYDRLLAGMKQSRS